jgi:phage shock protein A
MKTTLLALLALSLSVAAGCGKKADESKEGLAAQLVKIKDEVCACKTQKCAMDAKGKAEKVQMKYSKLATDGVVPQSVIDNFDAMESCYRAVNEGRQ